MQTPFGAGVDARELDSAAGRQARRQRRVTRTIAAQPLLDLLDQVHGDAVLQGVFANWAGGKFLLAGVMMLLMASIANVSIQSSPLRVAPGVLAVGLLGASSPEQLKRVRDGHEHLIPATWGVCRRVCRVWQSRLVLRGIARGRHQ